MNSWRAIRAELNDAPAKARRTAWEGGLMVTLIIGAGVWDLLGGSGMEGGDLFRWATSVVGTVGLALFTVSDVLHRTGRARNQGRDLPPSERFRTGLLRGTYLVLPKLALVATALLALSAGVMLVVGMSHVRFWIVAVLFGVYGIRAGRTVLGTARELYGEARSQAEAAQRARSAASEARLLALQARMNPHFLFNALNTVASLVRTSPRAAERTVESLAAVLRQTLLRSEKIWGNVAEEVAYLEAYLDVERERWGERLDVRLEVEPAALRASLPPMSLQPLVENALEHGPGARIEGGTITVSVRLEGVELVAVVADDGPGMSPDAPEGTGLGNLRERLSTLYGDAATMTVESDRTGTTVRLRLPAEPPAEFPGSEAVRTSLEASCAS